MTPSLFGSATVRLRCRVPHSSRFCDAWNIRAKRELLILPVPLTKVDSSHSERAQRVEESRQISRYPCSRRLPLHQCPRAFRLETFRGCGLCKHLRDSSRAALRMTPSTIDPGTSSIHCVICPSASSVGESISSSKPSRSRSKKSSMSMVSSCMAWALAMCWARSASIMPQ